MNNNNKSNTNINAFRAYETDKMVTKEEVLIAYLCCIRNKRNTNSAIDFEINEATQIISLYNELNNHTYRPTISIAFITTRPKLREVFAANFRDRVVHHLFVNRTNSLFEKRLIADTYGNRTGKGTLYGAKRVQNMLARNSDKWILKCDIQSFFMNIDKQILLDKITKLLVEDYKGDDLPFMLWLAKVIILHRPELNCERHGDIKLWDKLPKRKSLFGTNGEKGLAIGNLTSQLFANYYLCDFDKWIISKENVEYGRYVDDFILIGEKEDLLGLIPHIRAYLNDELKLTLHPDKIYIQPAKHGVSFIGYRIYANHILAGKRIIQNTLSGAKNENKDITHFIQSSNSRLGIIKNTRSIHIRQEFYNSIPSETKNMIYASRDFCSIHIRDEYNKKKQLIKLLKQRQNNEEDFLRDRNAQVIL